MLSYKIDISLPRSNNAYNWLVSPPLRFCKRYNSKLKRHSNVFLNKSYFHKTQHLLNNDHGSLCGYMQLQVKYKAPIYNVVCTTGYNAWRFFKLRFSQQDQLPLLRGICQKNSGLATTIFMAMKNILREYNGVR